MKTLSASTQSASTRLKTILKRNGLSLEQAFHMSDKRLLALRNFGKKSLEEIRRLQAHASASATDDASAVKDIEKRVKHIVQIEKLMEEVVFGDERKVIASVNASQVLYHCEQLRYLQASASAHTLNALAENGLWLRPALKMSDKGLEALADAILDDKALEEIRCLRAARVDRVS